LPLIEQKNKALLGLSKSLAAQRRDFSRLRQFCCKPSPGWSQKQPYERTGRRACRPYSRKSINGQSPLIIPIERFFDKLNNILLKGLVFCSILPLTTYRTYLRIPDPCGHMCTRALNGVYYRASRLHRPSTMETAL